MLFELHVEFSESFVLFEVFISDQLPVHGLGALGVDFLEDGLGHFDYLSVVFQLSETEAQVEKAALPLLGQIWFNFILGALAVRMEVFSNLQIPVFP